jgi:glycosyltransferase involved in cell wall biosynthesis
MSRGEQPPSSAVKIDASRHEVREVPSRIPRVSVGVPVFDGENYVAEALDSLLAQTYEDFELIISDNASTDATEEICRAYACRDSRIRYVRNEANVGAAKNFNQLVALAKGEYFKWAAHDDLCGAQFLERCVDALDRDASVVLSYPWQKAIDGGGVPVQDFEPMPRLGSEKAHERFFECVCVPHDQNAVFGVVRTAALRETRLIGTYMSADRVLLGELVLLGRFYEIPEFLFFKRHHPQQHWRVHETRRSRQAWWDPARAGKRGFRSWRLLREHLRSIQRAPITGQERARSYFCIGWWIRRNWRSLARDLAVWRT